MTSLLTNNAASAALSTLRTISGALSRTSIQVSSGLRISKASDDAAYWSIATTMRSDNKAISAASDALGLGSAKVETAYEGVSAVVDVLSEFKAKLVTASESSVDKRKVQEELDALKQQVVSIADSASFNGENWLNTDIGDITDDTQNKSSVVASFVRSDAGGVAVNSMPVDLSNISLFNTTGNGLLQAGTGGTASTNDPASTSDNHEVDKYYSFNGPITLSSSDSISFNLVLQPGGSAATSTLATTITKADVNAALGISTGTISNGDDMKKVLNKVWAGNSMGVSAGSAGTVQSNGTTLWHSFLIADDNANNTSAANFHVANLTSTLPSGVSGGLSSASYYTGHIDSTASAPSGSAEQDSGPTINFLDMDIEQRPDLVGQYLDDLEVMTKKVTTAAATLGSYQKRIGMQTEFASQLSDNIGKGVGRLVDANMEESSTRLSALQTQQQLAIQSLSIANQTPQAMLTLFR